MKAFAWAFFAALLLAGPALAADLPGSKDHPLVKRYEGSEIIGYQVKNFDEYTLGMGGDKPDAKAFEKTQKIEGKVTRIIYRVPAGHSSLELARNYENALSAAKFQQQYKSPVSNDRTVNEQMTSSFFKQEQVADAGPWYYSSVSVPRYSWSKATLDGKDVYVAVLASEVTDTVHWSRPDIMASKTARDIHGGEVLVGVDIIETKALENKMVELKSEDMAKALAATGKVDLYGIYFDVDKTDIKPESKPMLDEVAKLLKTDASLHLSINGHTDNTGTPEHNNALSVGRATAVMNALITQYNVDKTRMIAAGYGQAKPVADNATEEGRAKNRRVELVKV